LLKYVGLMLVGITDLVLLFEQLGQICFVLVKTSQYSFVATFQ